MFKLTINTIAASLLLCQWGFSAAVIKAPEKLWYPAVLTFEGPSADESEATFRNYRLDVTFTKGTKSFKVPGYFAADGNASETSASSGNKWRVKFTADEEGTWNYTVSFRTGKDIAISSDVNAGAAVPAVDGEKGTFSVGAYDKSAPGFYGKGLLQYVGEHYAQFAGSREWFIKTGPGSPEDFFGYKDFDGTVDFPTKSQETQRYDSYLKQLNGESLHFYTTHVADWKAGDVTWKNGLGKGIIGALNYQASLGCNNQYMILLTRNDDSDNTWPWTSREVKMQYDVSKLEQWDLVLSHMDKVGIVPHIYLSEAMNTCHLDNGNMTLEYPIYYREIVARFGYHLGIRYSIGEEPAPLMTADKKAAAAVLLSKLDVFNHVVGCGVSYVRTEQIASYTPLLGNTSFDGAFMMLTDGFNTGHTDAYMWRDSSAAHGHKWLVSNEEPNGFTGADLAKADLYTWRTLMGGADGMSQYVAYKQADCMDITLENFRLLEPTLKILVYAKNLFMLPGINKLLPEMRSEDGLVENARQNNPPYCFAKKGEMYIVYRTTAAAQKTLDLTGQSGSFMVTWYSPRTGVLQNGPITTVPGGAKVNLGAAPAENDKSWAIVVSRTDVTSSKNTPVEKRTACSGVQGINNRGLQVFFPHEGQFKLNLFDCSGRLLAKVCGSGTSGINQVHINHSTLGGRAVFARLEFNGTTTVKQLVDLVR